MTTVLPTSRAIRQRILTQKDTDTLLARYMTMGELLSRALLVEGRENIDSDSRTMLLLEAADFEAFSELKIERNFFTFTKNATYLFRFFEELSGELVDIETLDTADTYGDFAEHIAILTLLRKRFHALCEERRVLERIFLPETYALNTDWITKQQGFEIVAEGYLTNFELTLLKEIAAYTDVQIVFDATPYNLKMQQKFSELGIKTTPGSRYRVDMVRMALTDSEALQNDAKIQATILSERMLQVAFVKQRVFEMIGAGIAAERIAVVLPDEGFVPLLRQFDREGNFNFAMGASLENTLFVRRCAAVMAYAEHPGVENSMRVRRLYPDYALLLQGYGAPSTAEHFSELIIQLLEGEADTVASVVKEELFYFARLIPQLVQNSLRALLHLFINRVKARSLDDVRGGKVTVMGVLETRACQFDGVIIVDFNDAYVPHRSEKDLFINSAVRGRAGLPTTGEREALQKQFYYQLISKARRVEIALVANEATLPSRFLKELQIVPKRYYADERWAEILFERAPKRALLPESIEAEYDFTRHSLSATALKTFLECRRRFYFRYVAGVSPHEMPTEMPEEHTVGTALHNALSDVYSQQHRYTDTKLLKAAVAKALSLHSGSSPLEDFLQQLWLKKLEPFFAAEVARFTSVQVHACEVRLEMEHKGLKLEGRIDRIDIGSGGLEVLDYKSGKYPHYTAKTVDEATDFQLEFYALLAAQLGEVAYSGYYDLNTAQIVRDPLQPRKFELLEAHLSELRSTIRFDFSMTETVARCRFCDYAHLCQREM